MKKQTQLKLVVEKKENENKEGGKKVERKAELKIKKNESLIYFEKTNPDIYMNHINK
jgi:hypothetical protein